MDNANHAVIPFLFSLLLFMLAPSLCLAEWPGWMDERKIRGAFDFSSVDRRAHFEALRVNGFNTLIVSFAQLDVDQPAKIARMTKQADWCAELGLHLFVTTRLCGDKLESRHLVPDGRRYVDSNGFVLTRTPCPIDPVYWEAVVIKRAQLVAEHSLKHKIDGWCLDPEMYAADYSAFSEYCYCEDCFDAFLRHRGQAINAKPGARPRRSNWSWLEQHELGARYEAWQSQKAESLARSAEQAIHKINPNLLIGVLVLDVDQWYYNAWARGFGSKEMPVIAFSESTYSSGATKYLAATRERFKRIRAHAVLCPGIYLRKFAAEEIAGQLFYMAQDSGGYWVFTTYGLALEAEEVPTNDYSLPPPHEQYLSAFLGASAELDRQAREGDGFVARLDLLQSRESPPAPGTGTTGTAGRIASLRPLDAKGQDSRPVTEPTHLRYEAVLFLQAAAGDDIMATLASYAEGISDHAPFYTLIAPGGEILVEGTLPLNKPPVDLNVAAPQTGIYKLALKTKANLFSAAVNMPHVVQSVHHTVSVVKHTSKMYFYVPPDCSEFFIKVGTPYLAEQARVIVWDADGKEAANAQTKGLAAAHAVVATAGEQRGKVWSFQILPADHGVFYSGNLIWDSRLAPFLAESPEALLIPKRYLRAHEVAGE